MTVKVRNISIKSGEETIEGIEANWNGPYPGQWVALICEKGMVGCGAFDVELMEKHKQVIAIAHGSPDEHLITCEDLLGATISGVTELAYQLGVRSGMTGKEAAEVLNRSDSG